MRKIQSRERINPRKIIIQRILVLQVDKISDISIPDNIILITPFFHFSHGTLLPMIYSTAWRPLYSEKFLEQSCLTAEVATGCSVTARETCREGVPRWRPRVRVPGQHPSFRRRSRGGAGDGGSGCFLLDVGKCRRGVPLFERD